MNIISPSTQQQVEETLVDEGAITKEELEELKDEAKRKKEPLLSLILNKGHITDEQLTEAIASASNIPFVNLENARIDPQILDLIPRDVAERYMAVPLQRTQGKLVVAMLDASNVQAVDFLRNKIGEDLKVYAASETGIRKVLSQYTHILEKGVASILSKTNEAETETQLKQIDVGKSGSKIQAIVQDSPISKALAAIMDYAGKNRASDIHIEPLEKELKVRVRIDGILQEIMRLPKDAEPPVVSRIKILSNLKIDEHRIPQDGNFSIVVDGRPIDIRVAISPVVWGEQVVLRLLDKTGTSMRLEDMGYTGRALKAIRTALKQPYGMILTSGPTGSGKTTSMYAMIQEIKSDSINIITLEDPVEYKIEGVNQIQVNPDVGLTFATGLRSILRHDPNIIMVGEIRDKETANLAVQASLTGHLVFSTLHTNSAAGILPRLLDMGVEPFLIASTVHTVIGQRLVRKIIPGGEKYQSSSAETEAIHTTLGNVLPKAEEDIEKAAEDLGYANLPLADQSAYTLYKGRIGIDNQSGYQGRMGLYEVFAVTEQIQELILKHSTSSEIQRTAQEQGMITMRQDGYLKTLSGMTALLEVDRVAAAGA